MKTIQKISAVFYAENKNKNKAEVIYFWNNRPKKRKSDAFRIRTLDPRKKIYISSDWLLYRNFAYQSVKKLDFGTLDSPEWTYFSEVREDFFAQQ